MVGLHCRICCVIVRRNVDHDTESTTAYKQKHKHKTAFPVEGASTKIASRTLLQSLVRILRELRSTHDHGGMMVDQYRRRYDVFIEFTHSRVSLS